MGNEKLKNMVILKNLPSNVIDEAIVILKPNVKLNKTDYANKNKLLDSKMHSKDYIINEAQMVISNYISKLEKPKKEKYKLDKKMKNQCKKLKIMSIGLILLDQKQILKLVKQLLLMIGINIEFG